MEFMEIKNKLSKKQTREEALEELLLSTYRNAASLASKYLKDTDEFVREAALTCVIERGGKRYKETIMNCLSDESEIIRTLVIEFIVDSRLSTYAYLLFDCLKDKSDLVRSYAAWSLGVLNIKGSIKKLELILEKEESTVVMAAIGESLFYLTKKRKYYDFLIKLFYESTGDEKCFVTNSLVGVVDNDNKKEIIELFNKELSKETSKGVSEALKNNLELLSEGQR